MSWVAANNLLFQTVPKIVSRNLALTVIDEAWWQNGLRHGASRLATFCGGADSPPCP